MHANQAAGIAILTLVANVLVGPAHSAPQNPSPARDVMITVSGDIMNGIRGLEQSGVMFLTSARQPLRSLAELAARGYKVSVYDQEIPGPPLTGRLLGNVLRHVQTEKPWQFDVLGPKSYLGIFKEDPPAALVVTSRKSGDEILAAGGALRIRFQTAPAPGQTTKTQLKLGWFDCSAPVIFLQPGAVTTRIRGITYDSGGYVSSFRQSFEYPGTPPIAVQLTTDPFSGCPSRTARSSSPTIVPTVSRFGGFDSAAMRGLIGFLPKNVGGVVVMGSTTTPLKTSFAHDSAGQRHITQQEFTVRSSSYVVNYSNVVLDRGRITAYDAVVHVKK